MHVSNLILNFVYWSFYIRLKSKIYISLVLFDLYFFFKKLLNGINLQTYHKNRFFQHTKTLVLGWQTNSTTWFCLSAYHFIPFVCPSEPLHQKIIPCPSFTTFHNLLFSLEEIRFTYLPLKEFQILWYSFLFCPSGIQIFSFSLFYIIYFFATFCQSLFFLDMFTRFKVPFKTFSAEKRISVQILAPFPKIYNWSWVKYDFFMLSFQVKRLNTFKHTWSLLR